MAVSYNGLSRDELAQACPAIAAVSSPRDLPQRCGVELPGSSLLRVRDVCPQQCASAFVGTPPDACSVPGGYSTSCGATVLAQAWQQCPEACQECDTTKRGCLAGAFEDVHAFIAQIKVESLSLSPSTSPLALALALSLTLLHHCLYQILSNVGHLVGVGLYAAYFKTAKYLPYNKL